MPLLENAWPWYVSGPLIGSTMLLLLFLGRRFGLSTNLKTVCSLAGAGKYSDYFRENWRGHAWTLVFALGGLLGGTLMTFMGSQ